MEFYNRDIQILRQSQSKLVLEFTIQHNIVLTLEELQRVTDVFVECCLRPIDSDLRDRIKKLDKWILEKKIKSDGE